MMDLVSLKPSELSVLHRLAIDPSTNQADIANERGITRSAVNQVWRILEKEHHLKIRSSIDYGSAGFILIFGWANATPASTVIDKFGSWLRSSPYTNISLESLISSTMDKRLYFEAIIPNDKIQTFEEQIRRFVKRPYSLNITHERAHSLANHVNLAQFTGTEWDIPGSFRFEASIGAARTFSDILPVDKKMELSEPTEINLEMAQIMAAVESDYSINSKQLAEWFSTNGFDCLSQRTLRRRLARLKSEVALPYLSVDGIGLTQRVIVCITDSTEKQSISKLLRAQSSTFPMACVVSGTQSTVIDLMLPNTTDWLTLSSSLSMLAQGRAEINTFITDSGTTRKGLERVLTKQYAQLHRDSNRN